MAKRATLGESNTKILFSSGAIGKQFERVVSPVAPPWISPANVEFEMPQFVPVDGMSGSAAGLGVVWPARMT